MSERSAPPVSSAGPGPDRERAPRPAGRAAWRRCRGWAARPARGRRAPRARACRGHAGPGTPSPRRSCRPSSGRRGAGGSARARRRDPSRATRNPACPPAIPRRRSRRSRATGRVDVVALRQAVEIRVLTQQPASAVEEHDVGAPLPPSSTRQRVPFLVSTTCHFMAPTPGRSSRRPGGAPPDAGDRPWDASTSGRRASTPATGRAGGA